MTNQILFGLLLQSAFIGTVSWIFRGECFQYANFSYVKENEVLQGSIIATLPGKSTAECEAECVREYQCKSINIQIAGQRNCELNSENVVDKMANLTLTSKAGWTYKATNYNETLVGGNCKYFKPCAVNHVCVDSCDCPGYICYRCRGIKIGIDCLANYVIEGTALGMQSKIIADNQLSASSINKGSQGPTSSRLNLNEAWCTAADQQNLNQWIRVDFVRRQIITGVAVQTQKETLNSVTKYQIQYSEDNKVWQTYEEDGVNKTFVGPKPTAKNEIIKQSLLYYIHAYSLKLNPQDSQGHMCLRMELYGIYDPWQPLIPEVIVGYALGLHDGRIKDYQMSASSQILQNEGASQARLNKNTRWCARGAPNQFIRVDFVSRKIITDITLQGHGGVTAWVSEYNVLYTEDSYEWKTYKVNGINKTFTGPISGHTMKKEKLPSWIRAFAIKIFAITWFQDICIRMELYGIEDPFQPAIPTGCSNNARPLGMASKKLSDGKITASGYSSSHEPKHARLNGILEWCESSSVDPALPFVKVDLGNKMVVTAVATQGRYDINFNHWVKSYYVSYSEADVIWTWVEAAGNKKLFIGNVDKNGIVKNKFDPPIKARYVRITLKEFEGMPCLRMELYGCDLV